jgi:hypothetical protein
MIGLFGLQRGKEHGLISHPRLMEQNWLLLCMAVLFGRALIQASIGLRGLRQGRTTGLKLRLLLMEQNLLLAWMVAQFGRAETLEQRGQNEHWLGLVVGQV